MSLKLTKVTQTTKGGNTIIEAKGILGKTELKGIEQNATNGVAKIDSQTTSDVKLHDVQQNVTQNVGPISAQISVQTTGNTDVKKIKQIADHGDIELLNRAGKKNTMDNINQNASIGGNIGVTVNSEAHNTVHDLTQYTEKGVVGIFLRDKYGNVKKIDNQQTSTEEIVSSSEVCKPDICPKDEIPMDTGDY